MADTVLVDAAWLVEVADSGGILPRCQDVPERAKVRPEELEPWTMLFMGLPILGVLAISYPWLARNHPDEKGEQLRRVAFVLRAFVKVANQPFPNCKVGVFWDYCSLPQRHILGEDDRAPEELSRFKRALKNINTWYAHPGTYVLLVNTPLPHDPAYTNLQEYAGRGWCEAEKRMSLAAKYEQCLIDLSRCDGSEEDLFDAIGPDGTKVDGIIEKSRSGRPPPQDPPAFSAALAAGVASGSIKFTNSGDVGLVSSIYERAFLQELAELPAIAFDNMGWADEDFVQMVASLRFIHVRGGLTKLEQICCRSNRLGDVGARALAQMLREGVAPALREVDVRSLHKEAQQQAATQLTRSATEELVSAAHGRRVALHLHDTEEEERANQRLLGREPAVDG